MSSLSTDHVKIVAAVTGAAQDLGLAVDEPVVLRSGANLLLHLSPAPVVARVPTLTADMRRNPADYLRRELEISGAVAKAGAMVVPPTPLVDPGPHRVGEHCFGLLEYRELEPLDTDSSDYARAVGTAYAELARPLGELSDELGLGDAGHPWAEIDRLIDVARPSVEDREIATIIGEITRLQASEPDDEHRLVHGDAHRNNVALSSGEVVWFDFEDANRRPLEWDLASLRRSWPAAGDVACDLLGVDPTTSSMQWYHDLRDVYALLWSLFYAQRFVAHQKATEDRLAEWLTAHQP